MTRDQMARKQYFSSRFSRIGPMLVAFIVCASVISCGQESVRRKDYVADTPEAKQLRAWVLEQVITTEVAYLESEDFNPKKWRMVTEELARLSREDPQYIMRPRLVQEEIDPKILSSRVGFVVKHRIDGLSWGEAWHWLNETGFEYVTKLVPKKMLTPGPHTTSFTIEFYAGVLPMPESHLNTARKHGEDVSGEVLYGEVSPVAVVQSTLVEFSVPRD